ncbi:MAG: hypothetical protein WA840_13440 [Caulobacteraceae bacterium]
MNRRSILKFTALLGLGGAAAAHTAAGAAPARRKTPIVLYCDLAVDPKREQEMLDAYRHHFRPAAETFRGRGFIDLKMLKLRRVIRGGPAPAKGFNYRFQLTYESEEQRQVWIHSAIHKKNWPLIENTLVDKGYLVLLTDEV